VATLGSVWTWRATKGRELRAQAAGEPYYGVIAFAQTATAALMVWPTGHVLQWVGHKADVEQTATAMRGIRLLMSAGAAIRLTPGAVFCAPMPLIKRCHQAVLKAIEARKAGEPWETDDVRAVL
jgi:Na+/melibiose symporter-like transporter